MYCRLAHISTDPKLGVKTPANSRIFAFLAPTTFKDCPLRVRCSKGMNKSYPMGHAAYRIGGNLGPLTPAMSSAKHDGFDEILWLLND